MPKLSKKNKNFISKKANKKANKKKIYTRSKTYSKLSKKKGGAPGPWRTSEHSKQVSEAISRIKKSLTDLKKEVEESKNSVFFDSFYTPRQNIDLIRDFGHVIGAKGIQEGFDNKLNKLNELYGQPYDTQKGGTVITDIRPDLPPPWKKITSPEGDYYFNPDTSVTQWELPTAEPAQAAQPFRPAVPPRTQPHQPQHFQQQQQTEFLKDQKFPVWEHTGFPSIIDPNTATNECFWNPKVDLPKKILCAKVSYSTIDTDSIQNIIQKILTEFNRLICEIKRNKSTHNHEKNYSSNKNKYEDSEGKLGRFTREITDLLKDKREITSLCKDKNDKIHNVLRRLIAESISKYLEFSLDKDEKISILNGVMDKTAIKYGYDKENFFSDKYRKEINDELDILSRVRANQ